MLQSDFRRALARSCRGRATVYRRAASTRIGRLAHDLRRLDRAWPVVPVAAISLTGGPTVGQLKTSLSHLEYENAPVEATVAKLEQENRSMEDRLVQEQIDNGDLTARLDDARNLLRDRGSSRTCSRSSRRTRR